MATAWDVASFGWAITVVGWLVSPIITLLLPKILACLGFDPSQKLHDLEFRIIPELENTLRTVDQERMMQRASKQKSDVAALDKMATELRHAREDTEDIFDDAQERIVCRDILDDAVQTFRRSCLVIACVVLSRLACLLQSARRRYSPWFTGSTSGEAMTIISAAASDEPGLVAIDISGSDESVPVTASVAASQEPAAPTSDTLGRWLSCFCSSFDLFEHCWTSTFNWLRFYRDWSYEAAGFTSYQLKNATLVDIFLTAISRRKLKKRVEKVETTITELKKSPLLGMASNSTPNVVANKNRRRLGAASKRKVFGREVLRDDIMARLREIPQCDAPSSSTSLCYSVIGIYGVAGCGKTTFAGYIRDYIKEECKEKLFDTIMCIHVSENFIVEDIFQAMLKDIGEDSHSNISDRGSLNGKLKEALCGKRFFLILDDL
uniref:NB-ARC domain-containing protein n=1 Tax=Triticum urartu TaxID=4572 RepID=A0A8R7P4S0_TRIUA